ncbi:MAG TPA: hypothetical protein VEQ42_08780, partial [Pyrinomonadaceae bacterium]|nr:hypothetical protein [Pyrinomonadaceae bacterium]
MRPTMPDRTSRRAALACAGLLALSALWPARPAAAQIPEFPKPPEIPDACVKGCQWNDPLCKDREANCVFKLNKYKAYMVLIGAGAPVAPLPAVYVTVLQPFYPALNLNDVSVAYSPRQLNSIAITDCYTVYFNDLTYFSRVRDAALTKGVDDHKRLYHELTHAEQCAAGGGRDNYAVRWWGELDVAFVNNPDPLMLHDSMPMEGEADARADFVDDELVDGLLPQLFISGMRADRASPVTVNSDVTLTAEAGEGGSAEFAFDVRLEPSGVTTARQAFGSGNVFRWWPAEEGRYRVTASVRRRGLLLPPNEASTVYEVAG